MAREGIYIGNDEVVARYIGNKLIWEIPLIEVGHFENFNDWVSGGETLTRSFTIRKNYGESRQPDYNYNASKAKINGKFYDIKKAEMVVQDFYSVWNYAFIITFKNISDRDEVARMSQKDIYLYKRG